jgi:hypothetical protein
MSERTEPRVVMPLRDTWNYESSAGAWYIDPIAGGAPGSAAETNARLALAVSESADAFSTFASPWSIRFRAHDDPVDDHAASPDTSRLSAQLLEHALDRLLSRSEVVDSVDVEFDTNAFIRTPTSRAPVRAWVRLPTELRIWSHESGAPYAAFSMAHTLFAPEGPLGEDNDELFRLNQPLLERGLRRWEERLGPIVESEGLHGVWRYGFRRQR